MKSQITCVHMHQIFPWQIKKLIIVLCGPRSDVQSKCRRTMIWEHHLTSDLCKTSDNFTHVTDGNVLNIVLSTNKK